MKTLTDIFNDYKVIVYPHQENYYAWFRQADNLSSAIKKAFLSEDKQGKVHKHQSLVGRKRLAKAAEIALARFETLSENNFDNFNTIHQFVKSVGNQVKGFGHLAAYDIALRIAKYQGCDIKEVHLHAGVTVGARAMGFDVKDGEVMSVAQFPVPFNQLSGDHLENLLCIYKNVLANASDKMGKNCVHQSVLNNDFCG